MCAAVTAATPLHRQQRLGQVLRLLSLHVYFSPRSVKGLDKNKDDLRALSSVFYTYELYELILLIFPAMSALSLLGTVCPSEEFSSYFIF